jgi:Ca2+-binding EF-hand superfamily protein
MKNTATWISAAAALALLPGLVAAADYPATFEAIDADGDGYISAKEAQARPDLQENWQASDANGDGVLDISEFSAFEGQGRLTPPESEIPEPGAAPY